MVPNRAKHQIFVEALRRLPHQVLVVKPSKFVPLTRILMKCHGFSPGTLK